MKKFVALLLAVVALFAAGAASYAAEDVVGYVDDMMVLPAVFKIRTGAQAAERTSATRSRTLRRPLSIKRPTRRKRTK